MKTGLRAFFAGAVAFGLFAGPRTVSAQLDQLPYQLKFNSGQAVQPYFEGWSKEADGSFVMHFGYLNRNYLEEVSVPLGPQNNIEPGGPDRGQPTYFYTRRNPRVFSVPVPKDFGKKELVWTITFRGRTLKAVGWLQPEWEIATETPQPTEGNQRPTLTMPPVPRVVLPATLTLAASYTDDGLPKPGAARGPAGPRTAPARRQKPAVGQETPPILQPSDSTVEAPINVPQLRTGLRGERSVPPTPTPAGAVSYIVWRGPAPVKIEPSVAKIVDGKAVTTATFTQPGEYVLRAHTTDGQLPTDQDVKVTVVAASATQK